MKEEKTNCQLTTTITTMITTTMINWKNVSLSITVTIQNKKKKKKEAHLIVHSKNSFKIERTTTKVCREMNLNAIVIYNAENVQYMPDVV